MLPGDFICELPEFDFSVVRGGSDKILTGMEADPVAASFMAVEDLDTLDFDPNE